MNLSVLFAAHCWSCWQQAISFACSCISCHQWWFPCWKQACYAGKSINLVLTPYLVLFTCNANYVLYIYRISWSCLLELPHSRRLWRWVLKSTTSWRQFSSFSCCHLVVLFCRLSVISKLYIFCYFCSLLSRRSMGRMPPMLVMRVVLLRTFRLAHDLNVQDHPFPSSCLGDMKAWENFCFSLGSIMGN